MQVQVNTNNYIHGNEELADQVRTEVETALGRFQEQITRVEVHLSDVNSQSKAGVDIKCTMEARVAGRQPVAVTHEATGIKDAVGGAASKLERTLESSLGRLRNVKGRTSFGGDQSI